VAALYEAFSKKEPSPLPELSVQYADFAVWQRNWLTGKALDELEASRPLQVTDVAPGVAVRATERERGVADRAAIDDRGQQVEQGIAQIRTTLLAEHLDIAAEGLIDPVQAFDIARSAAIQLDRWHEGGREGLRPNGRLRVHDLSPVAWWQKAWAWPLYRVLVDPDGRSRRMKRRGSY